MSAVRNGACVLTKRRVPQNTRHRYFLIYANLRPNNDIQYRPPKRVNLRRHFSGKQKVVRSANAVSETPLEKRSGARKTAGKLLVVAAKKERFRAAAHRDGTDRPARTERAPASSDGSSDGSSAPLPHVCSTRPRDALASRASSNPPRARDGGRGSRRRRAGVSRRDRGSIAREGCARGR